MSARALAAQLAGAVLVGALLVVLPDDVYGPARDLVLLVSAVVLAWVALALFLPRVRQGLGAAFALGLGPQEGGFGLPRERELRATFQPLVIPFVALVVLAVASALRAV